MRPTSPSITVVVSQPCGWSARGRGDQGSGLGDRRLFRSQGVVHMQPLTSGCKRRPEAYAALPLLAAPEPQRSASEFQRSGKEVRPQQWSLTKERLNFLFGQQYP
jgi:hypothetical protein